MEQISESVELLARREHVASFIQSNLQPAKRLLDQGGLVDFDEDVRTEAKEFEVREHQLDAWGALWDARQNGANKALVHLATGLGKTSVAVFDVIKFREEFRTEHGREPRVLFTSHKNEINEQAAERFAAFMPDASQGFYNGDEKVTDADLTFATLQSLYGSLDDFRPEEFDYIVYDEAHHNKADTFEVVVKHFKPIFQLALTATPNRMDELDIRELFGHEVYSKGLAQALAEDLLATPDYHIVFDEAVKKAMESGFEPESLKELRELFNVSTRNEVIAEQIKAEAKRIGLEFGEVKTIVFCNDIAHAEEMAGLLDGTAYHSKVEPKKKRQNVLIAFKEKDLQTITTRDMLSEGVDVPDARLIVFLRSTSSQTVFEQQLGRGLRKAKNKDKVSVLDFAANAERIAMVLELAEKVKALSPEVVGEAGIDTSESLNKNGDLNIKTEHGVFDFEKQVVDILKLYNSLTFAPAPEGYVNIYEFAEILQINPITLFKHCTKNNIEVGRHEFNGVASRSLSPEAQEQAKELGLTVDEAPDGYVSCKAFATENSIGDRKLRGIMTEHGVAAEWYKFGTVRGRGLSPDAQKTILKFKPIYQPAPESYASLVAFAKQLGVGPDKLRQQIEKYDIETDSHHFGTQPSLSLGPESQIKLKELNPNIGMAPEGHVSAADFAKELGITRKTLLKHAEKIGITIGEHRFPGIARPAASFDLEAQTILRQSAKPPSESPEGWKSVPNFSQELGITHTTLLKYIVEHNIETATHKYGTRPATSLSPYAQAELKRLLNLS